MKIILVSLYVISAPFVLTSLLFARRAKKELANLFKK